MTKLRKTLTPTNLAGWEWLRQRMPWLQRRSQDFCLGRAPDRCHHLRKPTAFSGGGGVVAEIFLDLSIPGLCLHLRGTIYKQLGGAWPPWPPWLRHCLVEMIQIWSEATDTLFHYIRVALLDFSKAFDLINHNTLHVKLKQCDLPPHIRRWVATFLLNITQQLTIGNKFSPSGHPNGGVPHGTLLGLNVF